MGSLVMQKKKIKIIGKEVIKVELNALKKLRSSIGESFYKIIKLIINNKKGKVIISGVGKSGIIARKWAATFSSTGTPAFYLDPSNASHGDMGQIVSNDMVILISNSGESNELKNIIQYTSRNKNIKLIGITSKKSSILYKNSDVNFLMPKFNEAGPENFIPTSSTIAQLALGDAIALACMNFNKFTKSDFKKVHPSGSLSIKLKTAGDLMIRGNKLPYIKENHNMKTALKIINKKNVGVLLVKNVKGNTVGIISDGDVKRIAQKFKDFEMLKLKKVMKKQPISIEIDTLAAKALSIMNNKKITSLCIHSQKNKRKTIGLLHMHDILKANIN